MTAAHFCLGHDNRRGEPAVEFEADRLAFEAVRSDVAADGVDEPLAMALVSARLATLLIEMSERGVFVRLPNTHPSADQRWGALTVGAEPEIVAGVDLALQILQPAVRQATDVTYAAEQVVVLGV